MLSEVNDEASADDDVICLAGRTELTVAERVDNGWRWLSENFPGWQARVDQDTLNLATADRCICGQVFARAAEAIRRSEANEHAPTGYYFAYRTLFAEANSWVAALVAEDLTQPVVTPETAKRSPWTDAHDRRAAAVAEALGFSPCRIGDHDLPHDRAYDDLQVEWQRRLDEHDVSSSVGRS